MGLYSSKNTDLLERIEILEKRLKQLEKNKPKELITPSRPRKMNLNLQEEIKTAKLVSNKKKELLPQKEESHTLFLQLTREIEKRRRVIHTSTDASNDEDILFNHMEGFI